MTIGNTNLAGSIQTQPPVGDSTGAAIASPKGRDSTGRSVVASGGQQLVQGSDQHDGLAEKPQLVEKNIATSLTTDNYINNKSDTKNLKATAQFEINSQQNGADTSLKKADIVSDTKKTEPKPDSNQAQTKKAEVRTTAKGQAGKAKGNSKQGSTAEPTQNSSTKQSKGFLHKFGIIQSILNFLGRGDLAEEKAISEICSSVKQEFQQVIDAKKGPILQQKGVEIEAEKQQSSAIRGNHREVSVKLSGMRALVAKGFGFFVALRNMLPGFRSKHEPLTEQKSVDYLEAKVAFHFSENEQTKAHEKLSNLLSTSRLIGGIFNSLNTYAVETVDRKETEFRKKLHSRDPGFSINSTQAQAKYKNALRNELVEQLNEQFKKLLDKYQERLTEEEFQAIQDFQFTASVAAV